MTRAFALTVLILVAAAPALAAGDALLDQGETALRHRKFEDALALFRKARDAAPDSVHAHLGYQEAGLRTGREKEIAAEYEKHWGVDKTDPVRTFLYARLLPVAKAEDLLSTLPRRTWHVHLLAAEHALGRGEPAGDALEAAAKGCPEAVRDLGLLAAAYEKAGRAKDAKAAWERAKKLDAARIAVLVGLGEAQRQLGDLDPALDNLQRAVDLDRDDPEAFYRLGLVRHDRKEWKEAVEPLDRAALMAPRDLGPLLLLGECHMKLGRYEDAERRLKVAYELAPDRTDVKRRLAECFELADKNDDALRLYNEILKANPIDSNARKGIGWIYVKKGKFDEGIAELRQAADMDPKDVTPLYLIGYTYDQMGRWGEAADAYEKALKVDEEHAWSWHNLGLDQAVLGDESKALRSLKKAVDLAPDNAHFRMNYGWALFGKKKTKDAIEQFEAVVKMDPAHLAAHVALAATWAEVRRYDKSAEEYEKAIEIAKDDPDLHLEAGLVYQEFLKDEAKALAHYEQYLVLGGADPVVQQWVDELKEKVK